MQSFLLTGNLEHLDMFVELYSSVMLQLQVSIQCLCVYLYMAKAGGNAAFPPSWSLNALRKKGCGLLPQTSRSTQTAVRSDPSVVGVLFTQRAADRCVILFFLLVRVLHPVSACPAQIAST